MHNFATVIAALFGSAIIIILIVALIRKLRGTFNSVAMNSKIVLEEFVNVLIIVVIFSRKRKKYKNQNSLNSK